ncbi:hypothetical protein LLH23_21315 [bacterium]|nr:hypothetical protein [bacterium]
MRVGICLAGGTQELARVDPVRLADFGFGPLFIGCYEDDVHWRAEEIATFVRRARSRGMASFAVPWGFGKVLDPDPAVPSLYVETHPQSLQVDSRGRRVPKACPNDPYFLEWFSSNMRTLAWMLEVEGFLWDEPSFHHSRSNWACRCEYCQRLFQASFGFDMPRDFNEKVADFRERSLVMFLLAAAAAVQSVDQRLQSLIMPAPVMPGTQVPGGTGNWPALAACSACDVLSLFVPWQHNDVPMHQAVRELQMEGGKVVERYGKRHLLWIAASPSPRDRILDALPVAAEAGVETFVLADYGSLFEAAHFDRIEADLRRVIAQVT